MKKSVTPDRSSAENPMQERILGAAFKAFTEDGYAGTSTLDIATRAKISKRDLYANFSSKHAVLVACIMSRADRMRLPPDLPTPRNRQMLASTLTSFATKLVSEVSHPSVIATFRLAIAEATRSPEIAQALDVAGRGATRGALAELLADAQSIGLIGPGEPTEMATQYLGLLWRA
jgi:AcrR family transcriptional regulator